MLKSGVYIHECEWCNRVVGHISINVKETDKSFALELLENTVRYDAPQIDDLFSKSKRVVIRKNGSNHAIVVFDDENFCIYPYRVGVPYGFSLVKKD